MTFKTAQRIGAAFRMAQGVLLGLAIAAALSGAISWLQAIPLLLLASVGNLGLWLVVTRLSPVELPRGDRRQVAYHEAGHAIVAWFHPDHPGAWEAKITPRSMLTSGLMTSLADNTHLPKLRTMLAGICVSLGGRAAEHLACRDVSTAASADLERVRSEAESLARNYGMGPGGLPRAYRKQEDTVTEWLLQQQVDQLINECWEVTLAMLNSHRTELNRVARALMDQDRLSHQDLRQLIGTPLRRR
jgi:ATP-dependent Zn protease